MIIFNLQVTAPDDDPYNFVVDIQFRKSAKNETCTRSYQIRKTEAQEDPNAILMEAAEPLRKALS
jgi:hypothetical protein